MVERDLEELARLFDSLTVPGESWFLEVSEDSTGEFYLVTGRGAVLVELTRKTLSLIMYQVDNFGTSPVVELIIQDARKISLQQVNLN